MDVAINGGRSKIAVFVYTACFFLIGVATASAQDAEKRATLEDLTELFFSGKYEECLQRAGRQLVGLKGPSEEHEVHLFVLGGSYHYSGMFLKARPLLDEFMATYGEGKGDKGRLMAASYFQAANYSRLMEIEKSAAHLDAFLKKYPDAGKNPYLPFALYDRAMCHYAEAENEKALEKLKQFKTVAPESPILVMVHVLEGNVYESLFRDKEAEESYFKGLRLAGEEKNVLVESECYFYLVALLGRETIEGKLNPRLEEALKYYHQYWEKHGVNSLFAAKVAVAGLPAMRKAGKFDEGLERLSRVIASIAEIPGAPGLEAAVGSYSAAYLRDHSVEELAAHLFDSPGKRSKPLAALHRMAVIDAYEKLLNSDKAPRDGKELAALKAKVKVLYADLKAEFELKHLASYILVKVGDWIRENDKDPQGAKAYYEEILARGNFEYQSRALQGLKQLKAK